MTRGALDELLPALHADGITGRVVDVDYEFQVGGNQMLFCTPKKNKVSRL
jgi:hypothetical protein